MPFWNAIANGLKGLGKGLLGVNQDGPDYSSILSGIGSTASGAAKGSFDTRNIENQNQLGYDRLNLSRSGTQNDQTLARDSQGLQRAALLEKMGMDRANLGISAPMARAKQAAYGDGLKNVQDMQIDFQPTTGALPKFGVTGGLRPSMFGENARAAGGELGRQALMALMTKSDVPAMTHVPEASPLVDLPEMTKPKGSGVLEKTMGGVGLGGSILGGIGELLKKRRMGGNTGVVKPVPTMGMQDPNIFGKVTFG